MIHGLFSLQCSRELQSQSLATVVCDETGLKTKKKKRKESKLFFFFSKKNLRSDLGSSRCHFPEFDLRSGILNGE